MANTIEAKHREYVLDIIDWDTLDVIAIEGPYDDETVKEAEARVRADGYSTRIVPQQYS